MPVLANKRSLVSRLFVHIALPAYLGSFVAKANQNPETALPNGTNLGDGIRNGGDLSRALNAAVGD